MRSGNMHETSYNASDEVIVVIICLLFTFSPKQFQFLNVITREHVTFLAAYSVTSSL